MLPVTTPVLLTVATAAFVLLQAPLEAVSASVRLLPAHTVVGPVITPAEGAVFTVIIVLSAAAPQLLLMVYTNVAMPVVTPVARPVALLIEAIAGARVAHTPPLIVDEKEADTPVHKVAGPLSVPAEVGATLTVTGAAALTVPQLPVTV